MHRFYKKIVNLNFVPRSFFLKNDLFIKVENRNLAVKKEWVGFKLAVYNGRYYIPLLVKENMVGKMLGSLIFTKKILLKSKKKFRK